MRLSQGSRREACSQKISTYTTPSFRTKWDRSVHRAGEKEDMLESRMSCQCWVNRSVKSEKMMMLIPCLVCIPDSFMDFNSVVTPYCKDSLRYSSVESSLNNAIRCRYSLEGQQSALTGGLQHQNGLMRTGVNLRSSASGSPVSGKGMSACSSILLPMTSSKIKS